MIDKGAVSKIWDGQSETECVELCQELQKAGIEYTTSQSPVSRSSRMGVVWRFEVYVPNPEYESAKQLLNLGEERDDSISEIEEYLVSDGLDLDDRANIKGYLERWHPENATVEVGQSKEAEGSSIVGMSLTENLIHYRVERSEGGRTKYLVCPEDEVRAREILREISEGDPPH